MNFDKNYVMDITKKLLKTDSPTGYTNHVMDFVNQEASKLGIHLTRTTKGNGIISIDGHSKEKTIGLSAHVDTLGLMVRSIKKNGTLTFTKLGSPILPTLDGEYCQVVTRDGQTYSGTILSNSPAIHVFENASTERRKEETMHVRLDEVVSKEKDVHKLGIGTGDFICIDTKTEFTESGYIKSRFLDDKLSVGLLFGVLKFFKDNNIVPRYNVKFLFSIYEEVGHGMAWIPEDITDLIAVDMGCIGEDLNCTEHDVSICAKDSSGPYDFNLTNELIGLARKNDLKFAVDIFPMYSSDVSAALKGGCDIRGALIGPGVSASHGMERSHYDAVENTMKLICLFLS